MLISKEIFEDWTPRFEMAYHGSKKHLYAHHLLFKPNFITGKISYIVKKTYEPDREFDTLDEAIDYYNEGVRYDNLRPFG